jgi:hypothetical protein
MEMYLIYFKLEAYWWSADSSLRSCGINHLIVYDQECEDCREQQRMGYSTVTGGQIYLLGRWTCEKFVRKGRGRILL